MASGGNSVDGWGFYDILWSSGNGVSYMQILHIKSTSWVWLDVVYQRTYCKM